MHEERFITVCRTVRRRQRIAHFSGMGPQIKLGRSAFGDADPTSPLPVCTETLPLTAVLT